MSTKEYHDFIEREDSAEENVQPYMVKSQGEYVSIRQWDGTGECIHWVLIPKDELVMFIDQCVTAKEDTA